MSADQVEAVAAIAILAAGLLVLYVLWGLGRILHSRANLNDVRAERLRQQAKDVRERERRLRDSNE